MAFCRERYSFVSERVYLRSSGGMPEVECCLPLPWERDRGALFSLAHSAAQEGAFVGLGLTHCQS